MKKHTKYLATCLVAYSLATMPVYAQTTEETKVAAEQIALIESKLTPAHGKIALKEASASIDAPAELGYLDSKQTQFLIEKIWGNPNGGGTLGALIPTNTSMLSPESWAIIITYNNDGYVKDHDAESINYDSLLKEMQESTQTDNKERQKAGYQPIELIGWAQKPYYDKNEHKLHWAQEMKFGDSELHTLNYDVRILGRQGTLILTAVASMKQLNLIQKETPKILNMVNFTEGNRYADFNASTDKIADYGLAAVVAGTLGMAAGKAGLFKGLIVALIAAKKFIIIGGLAAIIALKKMFSRKKK